MTQDKIIKWAYQEGLQRNGDRCFDIEGLTAFANLVAQHQKEQDALACKRIAANPSSMWQEPGCWEHAAENCAAAIRSQK